MAIRKCLVISAVTVFMALLIAGLIETVRFVGFRAAWDFFGSNLAAEVIGIVATVFVIDRVLKRREKLREEQLWHPTKQLLYDKLLNTIGYLLIDTLPPDFRTEDRSSGTLVVKLAKDVSDPAVEALLTKRLVSDLLASPPGADESPGEATKISTEIFCKNLQLFFSRARRQVKEIFGSAAFLLDPELTNLLHIFDQKLVYAHDKAAILEIQKGLPLLALVCRSNNDAPTFENFLRPLASATLDAVRAAEEVKSWLEEKRI